MSDYDKLAILGKSCLNKMSLGVCATWFVIGSSRIGMTLLTSANASILGTGVLGIARLETEECI